MKNNFKIYKYKKLNKDQEKHIENKYICKFRLLKDLRIANELNSCKFIIKDI